MMHNKKQAGKFPFLISQRFKKRKKEKMKLLYMIMVGGAGAGASHLLSYLI